MVIIFTDICMFCFSISVSVDPQKCSLVWYTLQYGVAQNPMLYSQHWNFVSLLCLWQNTQNPELSYIAYTSVCYVLCQVFLVGLWMELVFPVLQSKCQMGKGHYWYGVAVFVITHWDPLVNLWAVGTVGWQFLLSVQFVNFVSVVLSVSLSVSL